jgi:hypothetical protein
MCKPLPAHFTGNDIFNLIDLYMAEKGLSWKQCVCVCTDGVRSPAGKTPGFISSLHQNALAVAIFLL